MTADRWGRIKTILDAAEPLAATERARYLDQTCGEDLALRREVEGFLELEDAVEDFLPGPAVPGLRTMVPQPEVGFRIGPYRTTKLLGRGGMGGVYLAVREDDFEKQVAIKLIHSGLEDAEIIRRFETERQILAHLEHPSIARLLDGGSVDSRPYLVMEYVEGQPIDLYCDQQRLNTRRRLELFLEVCAAVAVAHRNLVVHRDLKPDNILVTSEGVPKLLDFGIAKLLDTGSQRREQTRLDDSFLTPYYASPEQIQEQPITAASDIYSLGVLLYELLTGRLPCDLESCGYPEIPARICQRDPIRPSTVIKRHLELTGRDGSPRRLVPLEVSRTRDGDPRHLRRCLVGDVDAIVLKALRKQPRERYNSVEQLAEDIRRHLSGLPVLARRGTFAYRTDKFFRRHRWGLATATVVLLLIGGFVTYEWRRLETQRLRAERVAAFLKGLVMSADPDELQGGSLTPRTILDRHRRKLEDLRDEPELYAELAGTLGRIYRKLGHLDEALELLDDSLATWRGLHSDEQPALAQRLNNLGAIHGDHGNWSRAEELLREARSIRQRLGHGDQDEIAKTLGNLASVLLNRGEFEEAEKLYRQVLDLRRAAGGENSLSLAASFRNLGALYFASGHFDQAEPLVRRALDLRIQELGDNNRRVASTRVLLANILAARGELDEAEALLTQALATQLQWFGETHISVARTRQHLAALLLAEGDLATVRVLLPQVLPVLQRTYAPGDWRIATAESLLGALYLAEGRPRLAEPCLVDGHATLARTRGQRSTITRQAERRLAMFAQDSQLTTSPTEISPPPTTSP